MLLLQYKRGDKMSERSKKLLNLINESGMSYGELSKKTRIPKSALQRYATGETEKIPIDRIETLAVALGTTPAYLMGWEDEAAEEENNIAKEIIEGLQKGGAMIAGKGKNGVDTIQVSDEEFEVMKNMLEAMRKAREK